MQELVLGGQGHFLDLGEGDVLVENHGQVAAHGGELRQRLEVHFLGLGQALHHQRPVEGGVVDVFLQFEVLQGLLAEFAKGDNLLFVNAIGGRVVEMGLVAFLGFELVEVKLEVVQDAHDVFLQVEVVDGLVLVAPQLGLLVAGEEEVEAGVLAIRLEGLRFVADFRCVEEVDVAELEELHVADLAVLVEGDALQSAPHQGLSHHVEVAAQRIQNLNVPCRVEGGEGLAVGSTGERVVHDLIEAVGHQHVADLLLHLVGIGLRGAADGGMDAARDLDVVVAIDAQDFFHHVGGTGHVDLAGVNVHNNVLVVLFNDLAFKAFQYVDGLDRVDDLASHFVQVVEFQIDAGRGEVAVLYVLDFG